MDKVWIQDWNNIVRNVIFADEELRSLMKLPEDITLSEFDRKYFINAGNAAEVLTNESVRIVYGMSHNGNTSNPHVRISELSFDIYVRSKDQRVLGEDILTRRSVLITSRLVDLLTSKRYLGVYLFWVSGETDLATSAVGYVRRHIDFSYEKVY